MTEKQQNKVYECADSCTFFDDINFKSALFCIKTMFFNAVLGRMEYRYTQAQAAELLDVSLRTIVDLEKGKINNVVLILNYIDLFECDFTKLRRYRR